MNPEKLTKVKIEVTERLIKAGTVNDSVGCPFALALRRVVRKNVYVEADYESITLIIEEDYERVVAIEYSYQEIDTPAKVAKFMEKIDARDPDDFPVEYDNNGDRLPLKLPPLPKPFSINLKIKNKFLRPSLRA